MPTIRTEIDINAPIEQVRRILFDWQNVSKYHSVLIKSVESGTEGKTVEHLVKGDKVKVKASFGDMLATVQSNTADEFSWLGEAGGVFFGVHSFTLSPVDANTTHFVHQEVFSGLLGFLAHEKMPLIGAPTKVKFEQFCADLKAYAEEQQSSARS